MRMRKTTLPKKQPEANPEEGQNHEAEANRGEADLIPEDVIDNARLMTAHASTPYFDEIVHRDLYSRAICTTGRSRSSPLPMEDVR